MIDLHMHTFFSDGELIPSELMQRARHAGYTALAITDHADSSNIDTLLHAVNQFIQDIRGKSDITILPGVELTHVLPSLIPSLVEKSRKLGAKIVGVHGETIVEPCIPGTNKAAISAKPDFLAHPGLISDDDVKLAAEYGVCLEITTRRGHSLTNGHVAKLAKKYGAKLVINTDSHAPGDLLSPSFRDAVARGAGLDENDIRQIIKNSEELVYKASQR
ncbi:MAG: histidinol phosphate phosphatase domain-containing protein [Candidatus Auribacterota bacterium]